MKKELALYSPPLTHACMCMYVCRLKNLFLGTDWLLFEMEGDRMMRGERREWGML